MEFYKKALIAVVSFLILIVFSVYVSSSKAQSNMIRVTNTADSGDGSLRAALTAANQTPNSTIVFSIPRNDPGFRETVFVIKPLTPLPVIDRDGTVIDGASQTAFDPGNTNPAGPEIFIDGTMSGSGANGLVVSSNNNIIKSLVISNFATGSGILIRDASTGNKVEGCYIGTTETGTAAAANQVGITVTGGSKTNTVGGDSSKGNLISGNSNGVVITGTGSDGNTVAGNLIGVDGTQNRGQLPNIVSGIVISAGAKANVIGGALSSSSPSLGNVISSNLGNGLLITGADTSGTMVQGNLVGTLPNGAIRGNGLSGIAIVDGASSSIVGGQNAGNTIAFNGINGITVGASLSSTTTERNTLSQNSIFFNGSLGIDLGANGVTQNDLSDADSGPNRLVNFPVINAVKIMAGNVVVSGTLDTLMPEKAVVEIFTSAAPSPGADPTGFGEGQNFVASTVPDAMGNFTASFPSTPNIVITATATDAVGNTSEFSAAFVFGVGLADITVPTFSVTPTSINTGSTARVQFIVRNAGTSTASATRQDIYISTDSTITAQDTLLASALANPIAPQGMQMLQLDVTIPSGLSGSFFIGVIADATQAVSESNENNNSASTAVTIISQPDLVVSGLTIRPVSVNPGDLITAEFAVTNQGSAIATAHINEVRLSTDNIITSNDILLGSRTSGQIAAGSGAQFSIDLRVPNNTTPGVYFVGVVIDAGAIVTETNEANNISFTQITVSGEVDLAITQLTLSPTSGSPGSQVALAVSLTNRGSLASPATAVEFRFSTDQNISSTDTLLGTVMSSVLNPGQSSTLNLNVTIPASTLPGIFFIGATVDPDNSITESSEANNSSAAIFTVRDQNPPTVRVISPNGSEAVIAGETFTITWTVTDDVGISSQDIFLSTDGGVSFSQVIATGLSGGLQSFVWSVPSSISTANGRIQIVARDTVGNTSNDLSDNNFAIGLRPGLISPSFSDGKLRFNAASSNIISGAKLVVVNGDSRESFDTTTNSSGSRFIVKRSTTSTPSGRTLRDAIPSGVSVQLIVRNPNGIESLPVIFQR
ncbi:MAG: hypothetical protein JNN15_14395 [Blastocatellia bacterium]|nr:hypothetical protein [Blastocatellia bacterium]